MAITDAQPFHVFTSITANYIPKARVLANSVKRFHPEAKFHLVLSDRPPTGMELENEPFDSLLLAEDLPIPNVRSWLFSHTLVEMCTAVKGPAFQAIADRYGAEKIFFLDPDIVVFSVLDSLLQKLDEFGILLTPHQLVPETDYQAIIDNEICSLKHGVYNLGFLGIRAAGEGRRFIDWWTQRCYDFCYDNIPGGLFTDQRWVDLAPVFFTDLCILKEPQYNVATWNLTHRTATGDLDSGIEINGKPLCFYHFSGFDSGAQEVMLNKYGSNSPVLFALRKWYVEECDRLGQAELSKVPCVYNTFDNGEKISTEHRLLYRQRRDLQAAFPDPFSTDSDECYYNWFHHHGSEEYIAQRYNYAQNGESTLHAAQAEIGELQAIISGMESSKFWKLRNLWFLVKQRLPGLQVQ